MGRPKVSVVVVNFNTREQLRRCLEAVERHHEVVVVDNASSDGSPEWVREHRPDVNLIANEENVGFGTANNEGIDAASGELILCLNSDCYPHAGAVDRLAEAFDDADVVAAGGRLLNLDGSLQVSSAGALTLWAVFCEQSYLERIFPSSRLFNSYWNSHRFDRTAEVEQVMGACLMMRPLERFDPRYFLYCEDTDLCRRLRRHGRIHYVPEARFTHELGASSHGSTRWLSVARYNRGKELYFAIHHGRVAAACCWLLNRMGAAMRLFAWSIATLASLGMASSVRRKPALFGRVLFAPLAGPPKPSSRAD